MQRSRAIGGLIISTSTPSDRPQESEAQLRDKLLEYQAILDNASLGICFTRRRTFLHCNQRFFEMFGWHSDDLRGSSARIVYPSQEAYDDWVKMSTPILRQGERLDLEVQMKRRDGSTFWCRMLGRLIDPAAPDKGAIFITEDITERKLAQEAQQQLLLEYRAILDNSSVGISFARQGRVLHCNHRFSEIFGWNSNELHALHTTDLYPSQEAQEALSERAKPILAAGLRFDTESLMKRRDGSTFWCRMLAKAIDPDDHSKGTIYITEDITERKNTQEALLRARDELEQRVQERTAELAHTNARLQAEIQERKMAEQQIRYLANHDALTGLPNRRLLEDRLEHALQMGRRNETQVAILFIDLDRFKPINDHLGHRIGDLLLQAVAARLKSLLRAVDTVARLGGDEFVILLPDMHSQAAALDTAQKVLAALGRPYSIEHHELTVTPSIGLCLYPEHGTDGETLLGCADAAMYHAKRKGRANCQLFSWEMKSAENAEQESA